MRPPLPPPRLSPALVAALAGSALLLLQQAIPSAPPVLEYRRPLLTAEPWRLLTGHFVHLNWTHALVNAGAWLLLAGLFAPQLGAKRQLLSVALGSAFVSLALAAFNPAIEWYRGASGVLHVLFFAGATTALAAALRSRSGPASLLPLALLVAGWTKVALEVPLDPAATPYAEWLAAATVPQAHLWGALAGSALGLVMAGIAPGRSTVSR
jgi:rhomboid family GlyGly-CTERM serine protease